MADPEKIDVLFMQSQDYFGADSMIHSVIMANLDRSVFRVHVACSPGTHRRRSASMEALSQVPDVHIIPVGFGPTLNSRKPAEVLRDGLRDLPAGALGLVRLIRYARKHRVRIVHGTEKPRDSLYGLVVARAVGARAVTHLHVKVEDWMSPLTRWAMRRDDALVAISDFVAQSARESGCADEVIGVALNAIDPTGWDPRRSGSSVRRELGISDDLPVVSIISRVFPWKGHELLLRALAKVRAEGCDFKLLVVGDDDRRATPGGRSDLDRLRALVDSLDLRSEVVFTGFRSDVVDILAATDIYAMPSFEEPFGVAYLEAMAMGKPVVALRSGGTPQVVDHGRGGLLSDPDDVDGLAANLLALIRDRAFRSDMGAYGRSRVEAFYNPRRLAADIERLYGRVLSSSRATEALRSHVQSGT